MNLFYDHLKHNVKFVQDSGRLFHGRGKYFLEHDYFNIDLFGNYLVLIFYREPTLDFLNDLKNFLVNTLEDRVLGILYQKRFLKEVPCEVLFGSVPDEYETILEGLKYSVKFQQSQNIGLFLDIQQGRDYLAKNSEKKKILNLFAYTCALSVVSLSHGANSVVNVDMSKGAIKRGILNHRLNNIDLGRAKFFDHDIFKSFALIKRQGPFDLVIIDPPTDHGTHFKLERDYPKLIKRLGDWMSGPESRVMTCLNSPHHDFSFLENMVKNNATINLEIEHQFGLPDYYLETHPDSGLKIMIWRRI